MCGITGRFNLDRHLQRAGDVIASLDILRHRGPDEQNMLLINTSKNESCPEYISPGSEDRSGDLFLGHARLSIIDLHSGSQPMTDLSGKLTIIFNGEIYNYIELRRELGALGHSFRTTSDTEVILAAYRQYGFDCVKHLNGMFAFAIYDSIRELLFCSRDRLGIKPFYYYKDKGRFIFASEVKSILTYSDIDKVIDYAGIADYLTFQYTTRGKTFHKKIKSLLPGHSLTIGRAGMTMTRYWKPDLEPDYAMTETEATERLRFLIEDSIKLQMRSDVQIGAHLSGGVDSSTVAAVVSRNYDKPLYTFTGRFDEGRYYDESKYALAVADEIGAVPHITTPTPDDFRTHFSDIIGKMDYPAVGPGVFPQFMVSKLAASKLKVVLGGQGCDELFLGYPRYIRSLIETKLMGQKSEDILDSFSNTRLIKHYLSGYGIQGMGGWSLKRKASDFDRRYILTVSPLFGLNKYFAGDLRETLKTYSPLETEIERFSRIETSSLTNKMSWYDITNYLGGLLQVEDRTSMAWSLESRVPLLDHRIVELGLKIPPALKLKGLKPKYIFRQAVESILPKVAKKRTDKKGFPTPVNIWFEGKLRGNIRELVSAEFMQNRNLFDSDVLSEFLGGKKKFLTSILQRNMLLWPLVNMEMWFREYVDKQTPPPGIRHKENDLVEAV